MRQHRRARAGWFSTWRIGPVGADHFEVFPVDRAHGRDEAIAGVNERSAFRWRHKAAVVAKTFNQGFAGCAVRLRWLKARDDVTFFGGENR